MKSSKKTLKAFCKLACRLLKAQPFNKWELEHIGTLEQSVQSLIHHYNRTASENMQMSLYDVSNLTRWMWNKYGKK